MKHKISRYKYEKVLDTELEIDLPEEPEYHFQTGIRRSICIIPEWTTWNKEHYNKEETIYQLTFICVYQSWESKIEMSSVQVSHLSDISIKEKDHHSVIDFFLNGREEYTERTKERFMADYNNVIEEQKRKLGIQNGKE